MSVVNVTVHSSSGTPSPVTVVVYESGTDNILTSQNGTSDAPFQFTVASPKLWSPDSPTLYNLTVKMGSDEIESYTGFRTISKGTVDGVVRPLLNGEFIFMFGTLDQGFWPDGIYTPPNREAMVFDLQTLKNLGFNMLRKHVSVPCPCLVALLTSKQIKVENDLFYQACDQMGLMLIQDMPALRPLQSYLLPNCTSITYLPDADQQAEFDRQLELLVNQHKSHPSIITWVI
jgi:beta-galactosidase/beta-glucuronidase